MKKRLENLICETTNNNCVGNCNLKGVCDRCKNLAEAIIKDGWIRPPCVVGDKVYFYKAELNEICPATVVGIYYKLHTPSMPIRIDILYESKITGRQSCEMASDVFELLCHSTKEKAEEKHIER